MAKKFKPQDIVKVISGSPNMTIENYKKGYAKGEILYDQYECVWFDEDMNHKAGSFHENVLELVKAS